MDEEEYQDQGYVGGPPQTTTPEAQSVASRLIKQYESGDYRSGEESLMGDYAKVNAQATQALRAARERLAAQEYDPGIGRMEWAGAMMGPTRSGSMSEGFGKGFEALAQDRARRQQFEQGRGEAMTNLDLASAGQDKNLLDARMQLQKMHESMQAPIVRAALTTLGRQATADSKPGQIKQIKMDNGQTQFVRIGNDNAVVPIGKPFGPDNAPDLQLAQSYRNYQTAPPAFSLLKDPKVRASWDLAQSLPGPDAAFGGAPKYQAIQHSINSWEGSGVNAQNMTRIGTAIGHMNQINDWIGKLGNGNYTFINAARNFWNKNIGGKPPPDVFDMMNQLVAHEVIAGINSRGGGEEERLMLASKMNKNRSPQILYEVLNAERGLQASRIVNNRGQYMQEIPGRTSDDFAKRLLRTDEARDAVRQIDQEASGGDTKPSDGWGPVQKH